MRIRWGVNAAILAGIAVSAGVLASRLASRPPEIRSALPTPSFGDVRLAFAWDGDARAEVRLEEARPGEANRRLAEWAPGRIRIGKGGAAIARALEAAAPGEREILLKRRGAEVAILLDGRLKGTVRLGTDADATLSLSRRGGITLGPVRTDPAERRLAFADDFARGPGAGGSWRGLSGTWDVRAARDAERGANAFWFEGQGTPALARVGARTWDRYRAGVSARGTAGGAVGLAVGCSGEGESLRGLLFRWTARVEDDPGRREIVRLRGREETVLAAAPGGYVPGTWYRIEGRLTDGRAEFFADGSPMLSATDETLVEGGIALFARTKASGKDPPSAAFDDLRVGGEANPADARAASREAPKPLPGGIRKDRMMKFWSDEAHPAEPRKGWTRREWTFDEAPVDWRVGAGAWETQARWACDKRWSFLRGEIESRERPFAALWLKRRLDPRACAVEAFVAPPFRNLFSYETARDLDASLCADPADPASGYSFVFGGFKNRRTAILRKGKVVAESEARQARIQRGFEMHQGWYRIRIEREGGRLRFRIDRKGWAGEKAGADLAFEDPEPLDAPFFCLWNAGSVPGQAGIVLARVAIESPTLSACEHPDAAAGPARFDGIAGIGPDYEPRPKPAAASVQKP